ncbi:hypothetical protein GHT06_007621 [Daphnia sinensis]|uniref:RNA-directed DNA polymerase n=1 Tax=Daphnia sinensis TaxID=1820382 RepID=A0AAD5KTH3_9CRUS|nr:hypothetical protein GHT06_007621 [Daphnia sinensis]
MIAEKIIRPSSSSWSSPVVLVRKKSGEVRFCIDYRRLNSVTERDGYPLPRVEDVLGRLSGAKYFSSLDLESGFWQMAVAEEHREKTAFVTPDGLFEFLRLPFGLCALGDAGLVLNTKKCVFGAKKIVHLGHVVDSHGISPDPAKTEAIVKFPKPRNVTELRAFLGLASFYRSFIPGFAETARPLHSLLKKDANVKEEWAGVHEKAMAELKEKLVTAPVLVCDDGVSELELQTDASVKGIGAVLILNKDGKANPITFISRKLSKAEENYHANELECLALVWALGKLRHFVYGRPLLVKTDSSALCWLFKKKEVNANVVADTLSRAPVDSANEDELSGDVIAVIQAGGYSSQEIALLQHADKDIKQIVLTLQGFSSEGGRPLLLVVPSIIRKEVIKECHDAPDGGHRGIEKTLNRVSQRFWWKGVQSSVKSYVQSCYFCQTFKPRVGLKAGKLRSIPPPEEMFHTLVCIDYLSRWVEAKPVISTGVEEVIVFLEEAVFLHHGVPTRLVSDKGPCFTSLAFASFCGKWNLRHTQASAEHPETNGLVEKMNGSIASTLAAFVNFTHSDWDEKVARAIFSINTSKQSTTEITPFELVFGRPAVLAVENAFPWPPSTPVSPQRRMEAVAQWRKTARRLIVVRQRKSKKIYDQFRKPDPSFLPGELVLIARRPKTKGKTKKFSRRFIGPYQVNRQVSSVCYSVEDLPCNRKKRLWRRFNAHVSQMRRFSVRRETDWCPEENVFNDTSDDSDTETPALSQEPGKQLTDTGNRAVPDASGENEHQIPPFEPIPQTQLITTRAGRACRLRNMTYSVPVTVDIVYQGAAKSCKQHYSD